MPTFSKPGTTRPPSKPLPDRIRRKRGPLLDRLWTRRAAVLLGRNTVVSVGVLCVGLVLLWLLVERAGMPKVPAAALSFLASNSIHYVFGRTWVFRGTKRAAGRGYAYFLANALVGLAITLAIFAGLVELGVYYLLARIIASIFAGLALFLLNGVLNFKAL